MQVWIAGLSDRPGGGRRSGLLLTSDNWNDWWKYATLFDASYIDSKGIAHELGPTKIGTVGLQPAGEDESPTRPALRSGPNGLGTTAFSLGQNETFYENVAALGKARRERILTALRDVAYDLELFDRVRDEPVMGISLMRNITDPQIRGQLHRMAHGGARLTPYHFRFVAARDGVPTGVDVKFVVTPGSRPPTNVHAVIGRNGVGKSTLLNSMAQSLVNPTTTPMGRFVDSEGNDFDEFNNLVSVTYSSFDEFEPISREGDRNSIAYSYIGLKNPGSEDKFGSAPLQLDLLLDAADDCLFEARKYRWVAALRTIENDPIFDELDLSRTIESASNEEVLQHIRANWRRLSSGHKIVLVSITRLVATVEEKTLVLLDEPEAHLHPPLLSAYIRALSELLIDRNGVAIVATHSPVVLQELPARCAWMISRSGRQSESRRPQIETFGENVGRLTNEVFGLEVTATGFHSILTELANDTGDYELALVALQNQLGLEGRALLRARLLNLARDLA